jgi:hypothetical protein
MWCAMSREVKFRLGRDSEFVLVAVENESVANRIIISGNIVSGCAGSAGGHRPKRPGFSIFYNVPGGFCLPDVGMAFSISFNY